MSGARRAWLVVRREWSQRVRSRTFRISTVLSVLIVIAIIVLPQVIGGGRPTRTVGLVGETPRALPPTLRAVASRADINVDTRTFPDLPSGRAALRSGDVDVLLVDQRTLVWKQDPDSKLNTVVTGAVQALERQRAIASLGLSVEQTASLLQPPPPVSTSLEPPTKGRAARAELATIALVLMFVAISTYGGLLLAGIVEEKSSRVVEVLLSRLRTTELLVGKIAGIGLVGLAQFAVIAVVALVTISLSRTTHIPTTTPETIAWIVLWFALGYCFYSVMYGAAGSLASRSEEAQAMAFPITAILLSGYLLSFGALGSPDSTAAVIGSLVPFTAPMVMTVRIASGSVPWWQIALSLILMVASIVGLVAVASRVYAGAVLRTGGRVKWRDAWRDAGR